HFHDPAWCLEILRSDIAHLNHQPRHNNVGRTYAKNIPTLQFVK
ncbi:MAG: hypothetical protein ACI9CB_002473, partial [Rhodothermales bacterium]